MDYESDNQTAQNERNRVAQLALPAKYQLVVSIEKSAKKLITVLLLSAFALGLLYLSYDSLSMPFSESTPLLTIWGITSGIIGLVIGVVAIMAANTDFTSSIEGS
jgi:hypothetical protein